MADTPAPPASEQQRVAVPTTGSALDVEPTPVQPRWYRRWEIMVPLVFVLILFGPVALWFAFGALADWSFERCAVGLRAQGYATDLPSYWAKQGRQWRAARDGNPALSHATVRLALYGAGVAALRPSTRDLDRHHFGNELVTDAYADLLAWMPNQAADIRAISVEFNNALERRTAMLETLHEPDWDSDVIDEVNARLLKEDVAGTGLVLALWPARIDGVHDLYRAARLRYSLGIDSPFPAPPASLYDDPQSNTRGFAETLSGMFLVQSYVYMSRNQPDKVVALWEDIYRWPVLYANIDKDPMLLSYGIRSGVFRQEHLQRLWNAPYPNADDLRDEAAFNVEASVATIYKAKATYKDFGMPNWKGLQFLTERYYKPRPGLDPTLLDVLPQKSKLLPVRALTLHWVNYVARLLALRGTQQWAELPDLDGDPMLGPLFGNIPRNFLLGDNMVAKLVAINLRNALLAFGLYRAQHEGRLPDSLQDFMTPELAARIIQCPHMELTYRVDAQGIARLSYAPDFKCPPGQRFTGITTVVAYHPDDEGGAPKPPPSTPAHVSASSPLPVTPTSGTTP